MSVDPEQPVFQDQYFTNRDDWYNHEKIFPQPQKFYKDNRTSVLQLVTQRNGVQGILGLEYIVEVYSGNYLTLNYLCRLCNVEDSSEHIQLHIVATGHRLKYLQAHFPTVLREVMPYMRATTPQVGVYILDDVCTRIDKRCDRLQPFSMHETFAERLASKPGALAQLAAKKLGPIDQLRHESEANYTNVASFVQDDYLRHMPLCGPARYPPDPHAEPDMFELTKFRQLRNRTVLYPSEQFVKHEIVKRGPSIDPQPSTSTQPNSAVLYPPVQSIKQEIVKREPGIMDPQPSTSAWGNSTVQYPPVQSINQGMVKREPGLDPQPSTSAWRNSSIVYPPEPSFNQGMVKREPGLQPQPSTSAWRNSTIVYPPEPSFNQGMVKREPGFEPQPSTSTMRNRPLLWPSVLAIRQPRVEQEPGIDPHRPSTSTTRSNKRNAAD